MRFRPLSVNGAMLIEVEPFEDERGRFSRVFSRREFEERGLASVFTQESVGQNARAGTIRGFHFQLAPYEEAKLVNCARGSAFDVILDIRPDSPTFGKWCAVTIRGGDWAGVYVPAGCAHAYQALEDGTEIFYRMSCDYNPDASRGYRWDSPEISVDWPLANPILSERDRSLPVFTTQHASGLTG